MSWLSGADHEVLAAFPGDRAKFTALGAVMTATAVLASISMWFFLHMALRLNAVAAVPLGLLWGAGIVSIDRMLVVSMQGHGKGTVLLQGTPRLVLALLLGFVISTPITLEIFSPEINNQIKTIQDNNAAAFAAQVNAGVAQQSKAFQQATTGSSKLLSLQQGVTTAQAALTQAKQQETQDSQQETSDFHAWHCELYGGPTCTQTHLGNGPAAQQDQARYAADTTTVAADTSAVNNATTLQATAVAALNNETTKEHTQSFIQNPM